MIDVACAIIERDGKVLAARRGEGMHLAGQWEFPGGKMHEGEGEQDCLVREISEELAITVKPLKRLSDSIHDYSEKKVRLIPYVCRLVSGEIDFAEHAEVRWFSPAELKELRWCAADLPVLEEYLLGRAGGPAA